MRFGDWLVECGNIARKHVEEAVERQILYGGRIGTNLVDLGHISLDEVGQLLGSFHGMPVATREDFDGADPHFQQSFPVELAKEYLCIPIAVIDDQPVLGVMSPPAAQLILAARKHLGARPKFAIAGELRILYQLEHVFGVPRENRFLRVRSDDDLTPPPTAPDYEERKRRRYVPTVDDTSSELAQIEIKRITVDPAKEASVRTFATTTAELVRSIRASKQANEITRALAQSLPVCFPGTFERIFVWVLRDEHAFCEHSNLPTAHKVTVPMSADCSITRIARNQQIVSGVPDPTPIDQKLWSLLENTVPDYWHQIPIVVFDSTLFVLQGFGDEQPTAEQKNELENISKAVRVTLRKLLRAAQR